VTFERVYVGKLPVDAVNLAGAVAVVERLVEAGQGGTVFTPNVDHIVVAERNPRFCRAYADVSLSVCDGMPVLWASRLLGTPVPEKVSGSDLFEPVLARAAARGYRCYLLGGGSGVAELAEQNLCGKYPGLQIVGRDAPFVDAEGNAEGSGALVERIRRAKAQIVFVAFGAPKSELFSFAHREQLKPAVLVCVGAAIDFAAGTAKRAPRWVSRSGLEWLYRLKAEPRRLFARYLLRDPEFLLILGRQLRQALRARSGARGFKQRDTEVRDPLP
jgi:N-acetylglucosaminyldiphosphoundecaprenol N-acetyl-beta-D-mannosaminyltransferase